MKIAKEKEVLAMFSSIMRGEVKEYALRKSGGAEEMVELPPKVGDRMHAAEQLAKYLGMGEKKEAACVKSALAGEIEALAGRLREEAAMEAVT